MQKALSLYLSVDDFKAGKIRAGVFAKHYDTWNNAVLNRTPVRLTKPVIMDRKTHLAIVPTLLEVSSSGKHQLSFSPIWCRIYVICRAASRQITRLVIEFTDHQVEIWADGQRRCNYSLSGGGVPEEIPMEAEQAIGALMKSDSANPIFANALRYIDLVSSGEPPLF